VTASRQENPMDSRVIRRRVQTAAERSVCLTTLYDVIAAQQAVVKPAEGDRAGALVAHWLCSGRVTFLGNMTEAA
jgi:hypothetical protein